MASPAGLVLLCGGEISKAPSPPASLRDAIFRHITGTCGPLSTKNIILAERLADWFSGSVFDDLLDLEKYTASLCDFIPLILEGPGTFAELGAFTEIPEIRNKLYVFAPQKYEPATSFVRLGPMTRLENDRQERLRWHHWNPTCAVDAEFDKSSDLVSGVLKDLEEIADRVVKEKKFVLGNHGHIMLLIASLSELFIALKKSEIKHYIYLLISVELSSKELDKYLFLLMKFDILEKVTNSQEKFYAYLPNTPCASYRIESYQGDRWRIRNDIVRRFYEKDDGQEKRIRAIRSWHKQQEEAEGLA